nr:transposase [Streptomyces akebiae]
MPRLRQVLAGLPQPRAADRRLVLAVDVSSWLRPDAPTSADRLFCHVYGRSGRSSDQFIRGWPYSFVAALESGRTSWCQLLDAVRLGPGDDVAEVTAAQLRRVAEDLIEMGRWHLGDRDILIVFDAGYDAPRMAHLLTGLPVEVLGGALRPRHATADALAQRVRPGLSPGRATAEARQGVPLRQAGDLGRAGRGNRSGHRPVRHRPVRHRPRDGLGPHPPPPDHPLRMDRPHRRTPHHRRHADPPPGRPPARRRRSPPTLALVVRHRPEQRGRRRALAGVPEEVRHRASLQADETDPRVDPSEAAHPRSRRVPDLADHRRAHPDPASARRGRRPAAAVGEACRARPAHPGPRPPGVSEPPAAPVLPRPCTETLNTRPGKATWLEEPAARHPLRRGQDREATREHHRTKPTQTIKNKLSMCF